MKPSVFWSVLGLFLFPSVRGSGEGPTIPYFRILAPQFLCSSSASNDSDFTPPSSITIALQTRGSERLIYRVQLYFNLLDGFRSQRHTLSVWRSIRVLEKKLRDTKQDISMRNQIDILNEELIAGVEYTFNIIGVDAAGNVSPPSNFTLTYRGAGLIGFDQESGNSAADISFILVGTWSIYRDMPFLLQGVIIFCEPTPFYQFHWTVTGINERTSKYLETKSKTLFIPSELLHAGSSHNVSVGVKNGDSVIAKASGTLNIIMRDFLIQLVPNNQSVGPTRELLYTVHVDNYKANEDKLTVKWECVPVSSSLTGKCQENVQEDIRRIRISFSKAGLYSINVKVTLNGRTASDSAFVEVQPDIIAAVEIRDIRPFELISGEAFTAQVRINFLVPQCTSEWTCVANKDGFEAVDSSQLEKGFGRMSIQDLDENFLSELIEYENDTTSYDLALNVPGTSPNFTGLQGKGVYLFRLNIECPAPYQDVAEYEYTKNATTTQQMVQSYTDLILRVNELPIVEKLDVNPRNGTALKTLFKFSTAPALDSPGDYPMRYKFFLEVDNFSVLIGDFYENTVTTAELPYSSTGIRTKYEVCDSRNACLMIYGPTVVTNLNGGLTERELKGKLNALKGSILRKDFDEFFQRGFNVIWTISAAGNETKSKLGKDFITDVLIQELKSVGLIHPEEKSRVSQQWIILARKLENKELEAKVKEAFTM